MARVLAGNVLLRDRKTGEAVLLEKGSTPPEDLAAQIGDHAFVDVDDEADEPQPRPVRGRRGAGNSRQQ